jgi:alpha-glucosidase (family GH31 glycosyl hydrolase)
MYVQVWEVPTVYFEANRAAMQHRVALVPYIYNAWRQAFDTGLSLIRPMYYDYPQVLNVL